ncbi:MAG: hypothetical protein NTZ33_13960 [Bacteroidetes bacterium]|nr:hypothetical protein [Bacteroidota bacterium]
MGQIINEFYKQYLEKQKQIAVNSMFPKKTEYVTMSCNTYEELIKEVSVIFPQDIMTDILIIRGLKILRTKDLKPNIFIFS